MTKDITAEHVLNDLRYLTLLARSFPTVADASTEIINLEAILNLPKGTEHFLSDIHGEHQAFNHVLKNASGAIKRKVNEIFSNTLRDFEKKELCTLIYYPEQKLELIRQREKDLDDWYLITLNQLVRVCRNVSSKYTRSKVRKALPKEFSYIIQELLHESSDEPNKSAYVDQIINTIISTGRANDFIIAMCNLIQRLTIDLLHIIGDIYDRGPGAHIIMDTLCNYHNFDIQWGNHDLLWMGAAAGEPACIATVLRNNLRYDNYEILENDYGISLRELVAFADATYTAGESITPLIKAINVLLFKLEGQIIQRHPEFDMTDRLLLDKIDHDTGAVTLADGSVWPLTTNDFPTVDPADPYTLTSQEQHIIDKLVSEFVTADHLHRHIDFLYSHGSIYKVANGNLLFHGCVPLNEDGTFSSMNCLGTWHAGRDYLDFCDHIARRAWRVGDRDALDWMWYLWIGFNSPASGRLVRTFERAYIADKSTWVEPMDPYFTLTKSPSVCDDIMREFGVAPMACSPTGHIINGHTPVKTTKGEQPIRAEGKLLVIDGGFCRAYHPKTGIAGYTLISSSRGCRLKSHRAFTTVAEALTRNVDIESETNRFDQADRRRMVSDTDTGAKIRSQIQDLRQLLDAYRNGAIEERA